MRVSNVTMRHLQNTFEDFPSVYYANRRLSADQESEIFTIMETFHSNEEIIDCVRQHWNIIIADYDLRNMRSRRREVKQPSNELERIKHRPKFLGFSLNDLKELFSKHNELLLFDSTTQCNPGSYHLWHIVVIDGHGGRQSVYYDFIENAITDSNITNRPNNVSAASLGDKDVLLVSERTSLQRLHHRKARLYY
ncbi:hypothetical protein X801_07765 [Opisthorchis viverrini]|uniref:ZSWIM1/3 RNaseH-like domain-containing protein n=1 Tax=Opisthorchis viverrini TaxID=6198 RepID=A0A1S8WQA9_OPIVI|nr:hypothetical protein X801_07765 [Opisthorchis viverrini]